jgi:hypothetical protein
VEGLGLLDPGSNDVYENREDSQWKRGDTSAHWFTVASNHQAITQLVFLGWVDGLTIR